MNLLLHVGYVTNFIKRTWLLNLILVIALFRAITPITIPMFSRAFLAVGLRSFPVH